MKSFLKSVISITIGLICVLSLTGCPSVPFQQQQTEFVQACAAYNAGLASAVQLIQAGKLNQNQVNAVKVIDQTVSPLCQGPLPAGATAITAQVTAAITTLAANTIIQQESK